MDTVYETIGEEKIQKRREQAWKIAGQQVGDLFSEIQIDQAERIAAQRSKVENYYRQQEMAVRQIVIENIRN